MHHDKCPNGQACMQNTTGCLVGKCAREIKTPSVDVAVSIAAPESQSTPLTDAKIIRTVNVFWTDASGAKKSAYELVEANFARRLERAYRQAIGALEKLLANHYYRDEAHAALAQSRKLRERR